MNPLIEAITSQTNVQGINVSDVISTVGFSYEFDPMYREVIISVGIESD